MEKDHDEITTDRPGSGLVAEWSYVCHCSKWPSLVRNLA
jgi:hypothetical protein